MNKIFYSPHCPHDPQIFKLIFYVYWRCWCSSEGERPAGSGMSEVRVLSPTTITHGDCRAGTNTLATLRNLGGQISPQPCWLVHVVAAERFAPSLVIHHQQPARRVDV